MTTKNDLPEAIPFEHAFTVLFCTVVEASYPDLHNVACNFTEGDDPDDYETGREDIDTQLAEAIDDTARMLGVRPDAGNRWLLDEYAKGCWAGIPTYLEAVHERANLTDAID